MINKYLKRLIIMSIQAKVEEILEDIKKYSPIQKK